MIISSTGERLRIRQWKVDNPIAQLFLVHGYAEHIDRYQYFAERLNDVGIEIIGHDLAGHGESGGERAYVSRFDQYIWDLKRITEEYQKDDLPTFLFGHSMGGLIVTSYCTLYRPDNLNGVITTGAQLKLDKGFSPLLQKLAPFLSEIFPNKKTTTLGSKDISRDPHVVAAYDSDPQIYREGIKIRLGAEMLLRIKKTNKIANLFNQPALFMHGGADRLTDPGGTITFYKNCASKDKELKIWDGLYHEILNEPEKEEVIDYIINWTNNHL